MGYKLKRIKLDLKCWNKEVFGNVERKKFLEEEIQSLDLLGKERPLVEEDIVKRALLKAYLEKVVFMEERQKSRVTLLEEGGSEYEFYPSVQLPQKE